MSDTDSASEDSYFEYDFEFEPVCRDNSIMLELIQMEQNQKLAPKLIEDNDKAIICQKVEQPHADEKINSFRENYYCHGLAARGFNYIPCNVKVQFRNDFCCTEHKNNIFYDYEAGVKKTVILVLIKNIPDANIRKFIYKLVYPLFSGKLMS